MAAPGFLPGLRGQRGRPGGLELHRDGEPRSRTGASRHVLQSHHAWATVARTLREEARRDGAAWRSAPENGRLVFRHRRRREGDEELHLPGRHLRTLRGGRVVGDRVRHPHAFLLPDAGGPRHPSPHAQGHHRLGRSRLARHTRDEDAHRTSFHVAPGLRRLAPRAQFGSVSMRQPRKAHPRARRRSRSSRRTRRSPTTLSTIARIRETVSATT